jgi:hypothetical protein
MKTQTDDTPGTSPFREPSAVAGERQPGQASLFDEHDVVAEVEEMFRAMIEATPRRADEHPARRPMPSPLPMQLILGGERLRALAGETAKITVIVAMPDRRQFEEIEFPGQLETGCDRHGFCIKAYVEDAIQVLAIHIDRRASRLPSF